jgi:hypothetical protein
VGRTFCRQGRFVEGRFVGVPLKQLRIVKNDSPVVNAPESLDSPVVNTSGSSDSRVVSTPGSRTFNSPG